MAENVNEAARSTPQQGYDHGTTDRASGPAAPAERAARPERSRSGAELPGSSTLSGTVLSRRGSVSRTVDPAVMRRIIIEQSHRAGVGHIGSALSVVDILAVLYGEVLRISAPEDPERDRFVLSKGHAALALYSALNQKGWITDAELNTFCADGTSLGVHPEFLQRGVDFATGSLGQGLTFGVGAALAAKWQRSPRRVFVLLSDAECNEGSVWEAVMLAKQHGLDRLIAIVDVNGQQALGYTHEVLDLNPLENRWKAFGWDVHTVDGHDRNKLGSLLHKLEGEQGLPHVVLAKTVFGKGVSFMEGAIKWHYLPLSEAELSQALQEIEANT